MVFFLDQKTLMVIWIYTHSKRRYIIVGGKLSFKFQSQKKISWGIRTDMETS